MTKPDLSHITDHALVRYMERCLGMDMEGFRARMDQPGLREAVKMGATKVSIDGIQFFCKGGRIVTLWNFDKHGKPKSRTRKAKKPNVKRIYHGRQRKGRM